MTHTPCFWDVLMMNGNATLQKINYLKKKKNEKSNVTCYILFLPLGIHSHSRDRDFISLYHGSYSTSPDASSQLTPVVCICQARRGTLCLSLQLPGRRLPKLSCHLGRVTRRREAVQLHKHLPDLARPLIAARTRQLDYINRTWTVNVVLTTLAKIAEEITQ